MAYSSGDGKYDLPTVFCDLSGLKCGTAYAYGCRCDKCKCYWSARAMRGTILNPELLRKKRLLTIASGRRRIQARARIKQDRGCAVCGYRDNSALLHIDHVNPEKKTKKSSEMRISELESGLASGDLQVLCVLHHQEKTASDTYVQKARLTQQQREERFQELKQRLLLMVGGESGK